MVSQLNPFEDQNQLGQQGLEGGDLSQQHADGGLEQGVGGFTIAHPTAALDRHIDGLGDRCDRGPVLRRPGSCGIEIDDVDPTCPCLGERHRLSDGIIAVHRLTSIVTLVQAHTSAASKVDRREQLHQGPATVVTKFRRMRMPSAPDFSGWN